MGRRNGAGPRPRADNPGRAGAPTATDGVRPHTTTPATPATPAPTVPSTGQSGRGGPASSPGSDRFRDHAPSAATAGGRHRSAATPARR